MIFRKMKNNNNKKKGGWGVGVQRNYDASINDEIMLAGWGMINDLYE